MSCAARAKIDRRISRIVASMSSTVADSRWVTSGSSVSLVAPCRLSPIANSLWDDEVVQVAPDAIAVLQNQQPLLVLT